MPASAVVRVTVDGKLSGAVDIGEVIHNILYGPTYALSDGSGADQISQVFADQRTLTASATEDLDLNGVLVNAIGATVSFTKVRGLMIRAAAANVNDVVVGAAATNAVSTIFGATTHTIKVKPGGVLLLMAPDVNGYGITAATADLLKIANGGAGTSVVYDIVVLGS